MTSTLHEKIATPNLEEATLGDLLDWSDAAGVSACCLYGVMQEDASVKVQCGCDCLDVRELYVAVAV